MPILPITSLTVGIFALLMVLLSFQVSLRRVKVGATFGDQDDLVLRRRVRAHGNFIEYAPLAVLSIGLVEFGAAPAEFTVVLAAVFIVSRILHAAGMLYSASATPRAIAMVAQHIAFIVAGGWLVMRSFRLIG